MKESKDLNNLQILSRFVIFLPLIIVIIFVVINLGKQQRNYGAITPSPTIYQNPSENIFGDSENSTTTRDKFDLNGPSICSYKGEDTDTTAYIKNKNIYAKQISVKKTTEFLLKGDCVYIWEKDSSEGQKICGVSQYLDLVNIFGSSSFFDLKTLIPKLLGDKSGVEVPEKVPDFDKVCKEGEVDEQLFEIPINIDFKVQEQ